MDFFLTHYLFSPIAVCVYGALVALIVIWERIRGSVNETEWCAQCDYRLTGLADAAKSCPECGASLKTNRSRERRQYLIGRRIRLFFAAPLCIAFVVSICPGIRRGLTAFHVDANIDWVIEQEVELNKSVRRLSIVLSRSQTEFLWPAQFNSFTLVTLNHPFTLHIIDLETSARASIAIETVETTSASPDEFDALLNETQFTVHSLKVLCEQATIAIDPHRERQLQFTIGIFDGLHDRIDMPDQEGDEFTYFAHVPVGSHTIRRTWWLYFIGIAIGIAIGWPLAGWISRRGRLPEEQ